MDIQNERPVGGTYLAAYAEVHARLAGLVRADIADVVVPACPGWRVRDVVAHLAGLCEDWVESRLDGYASERWTADQVSRYERSTCGEIVAAWAGAMTTFRSLREPFLGLAPARWAFGDAVIHEADIRGALGAVRAPDDAVLLSLRGTLMRWQQVLSGAGAPTLHVRSPDGPDWWLGTVDDPDAVVVETPVYELFRGLTGRRSLGQAVGWNWSADPHPIVGVGLAYPFRWASTAISD